jgi:aspartate-semialdehyde dehydrogenase
MFDRLAARDDGCIENRLVGDLACNLIAFLDNAIDGGATRTLRRLTQFGKNLIEALDLLPVSSRWVRSPAERSRFVAISISFGRAFVICC